MPGVHVTEDNFHTDHFEKVGNSWQTKNVHGAGGGDVEIVTASKTITKNDAHYLVNTTGAAVVLTVDSSVDFFFVYDSHANFALNNCTVDFGGGDSKVMSVDGEFMLYYKDGVTPRFMSLGVASVGAV